MKQIIIVDWPPLSNILYKKSERIYQKSNIKYYVSNSCFELWLFMHFDEFYIENKKTTNEGVLRKVKMKYE